jgi:protein subunit release factor B
MINKKHLFSVTIKDCEVSTFKGSGSGGQKRNKTSSGIRIKHVPSGAIGQSSDAREQGLNKRHAFQRMINTKEFQIWLKVQSARVMGEPTAEELVKAAMVPENIKTEIKDESGNWIPVNLKLTKLSKEIIEALDRPIKS